AFLAFVSRVAWAAEPVPTVAPAESTPVQSHTLLTQFPGLLGPLEFPRLPTPPAQPPGVPALEAPATPEAFGQAPAAGSGTRANYAPNMLGDAPGGGCGAVQFQGNLIALLEFPTFSCLRLSIAEDNSQIGRASCR